MSNHKTIYPHPSTQNHNQSNENRQQQFCTLARKEMNNKKQNSPSKIQQSPPQQQYSSHGRGGGNQQQKQAPAIPAHQSKNVNNNKLNKNATQSPPLSNEHALAIDALVAELELNTDAVSLQTFWINLFYFIKIV
jgi:hypothetical protein